MHKLFSYPIIIVHVIIFMIVAYFFFVLEHLANMGIEWMYKTKGDEKTKSSMNKRKPKDKNTSSSGCMSVIFNLFDLQHHHHFRFHHPSFMSQSTSTITHHQLSCLQGFITLTSYNHYMFYVFLKSSYLRSRLDSPAC